MPGLISLNIDKDGLIDLYVTRRFTVEKIADLLKTTPTVIYRRMKKWKIERRSPKENKTIILSENDREKIKELYLRAKSVELISTETNISIYLVARTVKELELTKRYRTKELDEELILARKQRDLINKPLNEYQMQIILGSLLGDGCLYPTGAYSETHSEAQKEYLEFKANAFGANVRKYKRLSGYIKNDIDTFYYIYTVTNKTKLAPIYQLCYPNGVKTVSEDWINQITPLGIALWYLDDGCSTASKTNNTIIVSFATNGFSLESVLLLQKLLLKFNIKTGISSSKIISPGIAAHKSIFVLQQSVNDFMDLIEPYVSKIPSMTYKMKKRTIPARISRNQSISSNTS